MPFSNDLIDELANRTGHNKDWIVEHLIELGYTDAEARADIDDTVETLEEFLT